MNKNLLLKAFKIAIGSSLAVFLAGAIGLEYATTAGVVTLLTIRNTKKDTIDLGWKRVVSFLLTIVLITIIMSWISNATLGFGLFMMGLVIFSYLFKWEDSVSVNTVIGTHMFIMEAQITPQFILNEFGIVAIGTIIAILVNNLYMIDNIHEIQEDTQYIEQEIKNILIHMAAHLHNKQELGGDKTHIHALEEHIDRATDKAFENIGNTSSSLAKYYVEYLNMRRNQCAVISHFYRVMLRIDTSCDETDEIAEILLEIANSIHQTAGMKQILLELEEMITRIKVQGLPTTQEEFVRKAEMFYILEELEELLRLKSEFLEGISAKEIRRYWA
ncbi:MAG: aromatic acid exporter family protein [Eubacteriales bacterium]